MYDATDSDGKRKCTVAEISAEFGVTRCPTIYRHLPAKTLVQDLPSAAALSGSGCRKRIRFWEPFGRLKVPTIRFGLRSTSGFVPPDKLVGPTGITPMFD